MTILTRAPIGEELLDDPDADHAAVRLSLQNIARANALFGGWSAVRWGLGTLLDPPPDGPVTMLDIGTGAGDLPARARAWAGRRGMTLRAIGLERHPAAARLAAENRLPTMLGSGDQLPLADRSVDVVLLSQVAHHLAAEMLARVAREMTRVARIGAVMADLRPALWAGWGYRLAGAVLGFDRYTIEDGVTSLRRGYTRARLRRELNAAGVTPRIRMRLAPRIVAVWRTDGSPP